MAQKRMVATVNADPRNRIVQVVVEHAADQSFSKTVNPRAKKAFRRWISDNVMFAAPQLAWTDTIYGAGYTRETEGVEILERRCLSVYKFTY